MGVTVQPTFRLELPDDAFSGDEPLVAVTRGRYVGTLHRGTAAVVTAAGDMRLAIGNVEQRVFLRSAAKPFQLMPAILGGAIEMFGLTQRELAVLCASHSGERHHLDAVLSVLRKIGLDESSLRCGVHPPLHEATARQRWQQGLEPSPACNNCSGAHAGMLVACQLHGWPIDEYGSPDHPLQRQTRALLARFAGLEAEDVDLAIDNCHVPTFRVPIRNAAQAFARLASGGHLPDDLRMAARIVVQAMVAYPEMIAGEGRFDTDLIVAGGGSVVAKGGAEAFQGIGILPTGLGIGIKISDGNPRAIPPTALSLLEYLDALPAGGVDGLESYRRPVTTDLQGEIVGEITPVFRLGNA